MGIITVSAKTTFNLVTGNIEILDTTDWLGQGIVLGATPAEGFIKIFYNISGADVVIYDNLTGPTPDMAPPATYSNQIAIPIPLDVDGLPLAAKYTVQYIGIVPLNSDIGSIGYEFNYTFVAPEICIEGIVNCTQSTLTSTDATDYAVANAVLQTISRAHSIYPPPASAGVQVGPANVVTLIAAGIYTTTNTAEVISTLLYLQDDGLYVNLTASGTKEIDVICDTNLSKSLCCLFQLDKNYQNYLCTSPVKAKNYYQTIIQPSYSALLLFLAAMQSGNETKGSSAFAALMAASGCNDCDCTDDIEIVQVINQAGQNNQVYVVASPLSSIAVTQVVAGSTTTFNIEVSAALQTLINNSYNAIVVSASPEITVAPTGTNPKTYTLTYNTGAGNVQRVDRMIEISRNIPWGGIGSPYLNLTMVDIETRGPDTDIFANNVLLLGSGVNNQPGDKAVFTFTNFLTQAKPHIYSVGVNRLSTLLIGAPNYTQDINVVGFWADQASASGNLTFLVTHPLSGGIVFTVNDLWQYCGNGNIIKLALTILIEK